MAVEQLGLRVVGLREDHLAPEDGARALQPVEEDVGRVDHALDEPAVQGRVHLREVGQDQGVAEPEVHPADRDERVLRVRGARVGPRAVAPEPPAREVERGDDALAVEHVGLGLGQEDLGAVLEAGPVDLQPAVRGGDVGRAVGRRVHLVGQAREVRAEVMHLAAEGHQRPAADLPGGAEAVVALPGGGLGVVRDLVVVGAEVADGQRLEHPVDAAAPGHHRGGDRCVLRPAGADDHARRELQAGVDVLDAPQPGVLAAGGRGADDVLGRDPGRIELVVGQVAVGQHARAHGAGRQPGHHRVAVVVVGQGVVHALDVGRGRGVPVVEHQGRVVDAEDLDGLGHIGVRPGERGPGHGLHVVGVLRVEHVDEDGRADPVQPEVDPGELAEAVVRDGPGPELAHELGEARRQHGLVHVGPVAEHDGRGAHHHG